MYRQDRTRSPALPTGEAEGTSENKQAAARGLADNNVDLYDTIYDKMMIVCATGLRCAVERIFLGWKLRNEGICYL